MLVGEPLDLSFLGTLAASHNAVIKGNLERNHSWESDGRDSN